MYRYMEDAADLAGANVTYRAGLMFDERAPDAPTRRRGLAPNCATCDGDGRFTDATGNLGAVGVLRWGYTSVCVELHKLSATKM